MIFGRRKVNFEISETVLKKNKIPLLLNYGPWKKFYSLSKSRDMEKAYESLSGLVEEDKRLQNEISKMQMQKRSIMAKIVLLSRELNENSNSGAQVELENAKSELEKIKEEIEHLYERREDLPFEIEDGNLELLNTTIKHAYDNMHKDEGKLKEVNDSIEEKRRELDNLRKERDELSLKVDSMYSFMHNIVGRKEMEKLDREFLR